MPAEAEVKWKSRFWIVLIVGGLAFIGLLAWLLAFIADLPGNIVAASNGALANVAFGNNNVATAIANGITASPGSWLTPAGAAQQVVIETMPTLLAADQGYLSQIQGGASSNISSTQIIGAVNGVSGAIANAPALFQDLTAIL